MRRGVIAVDRVAAAVAGLALIAAGTAALGWRYDRIPDAPDRIESTWITDATGANWWPWATGAGGILLVLLGLAWLAKHLPRRGIGRITLTGSDKTGRLSADANAAVTAAGQILAATPGVRDAGGQIVADRGQLVAEFHPAIEPGADLEVVRTAAEHAGADLLRIVGRDDLSYRIELRVARHDKTPTPDRVH
ncbi:hypothetical protein F1D05_10740 [Kribbella qitaiheensis]|uniref:Alkaline shock response membrane anchor protein AmaP n=1 Tax=Kribbella qitaiheensis TaxID=1544730 RepID=A0A7G6WWB6_9ACTN|nr:hypothetical protein [Kribbella qitaiheensis]QNE18281.1 hypothetical protein F1D05_10740 [Kribbella qitaiheensis]